MVNLNDSLQELFDRFRRAYKDEELTLLGPEYVCQATVNGQSVRRVYRQGGRVKFNPLTVYERWEREPPEERVGTLQAVLEFRGVGVFGIIEGPNKEGVIRQYRLRLPDNVEPLDDVPVDPSA